MSFLVILVGLSLTLGVAGSSEHDEALKVISGAGSRLATRLLPPFSLKGFPLEDLPAAAASSTPLPPSPPPADDGIRPSVLPAHAVLQKSAFDLSSASSPLDVTPDGSVLPPDHHVLDSERLFAGHMQKQQSLLFEHTAKLHRWSNGILSLAQRLKGSQKAKLDQLVQRMKIDWSDVSKVTGEALNPEDMLDETSSSPTSSSSSKVSSSPAPALSSTATTTAAPLWKMLHLPAPVLASHVEEEPLEVQAQLRQPQEGSEQVHHPLASQVHIVQPSVPTHVVTASSAMKDLPTNPPETSPATTFRSDRAKENIKVAVQASNNFAKAMKAMIQKQEKLNEAETRAAQSRMLKDTEEVEVEAGDNREATSLASSSTTAPATASAAPSSSARPLNRYHRQTAEAEQRQQRRWAVWKKLQSISRTA